MQVLNPFGVNPATCPAQRSLSCSLSSCAGASVIRALAWLGPDGVGVMVHPGSIAYGCYADVGEYGIDLCELAPSVIEDHLALKELKFVLLHRQGAGVMCSGADVPRIGRVGSRISSEFSTL